MRIPRFCLAAWAAAAATAAAAGAQAPNEQVLITARRLFDGRGAVHGDAALVIAGNRIVAIGKAPPRFQGKRYDLGDVTLLPGLIDVHSHIVWHFNSLGRLHTRDDGDSAAVQGRAWAANAEATIRAGVTTVQSPGSPEDAELRRAITNGTVTGPRLITSLGALNEPATPDELRNRVREFKGRGADVIKLFASRSIRDGGGPTLTQEQIAAVCDEGDKAGLRVLVHAHASTAIERAVLAGCEQIEHGIFASDSVLALMAQRGTYFSPQCGLIFRNYLDNRDRFEGVGNYTAAGFAAMEEAIPVAIDVVRRAARTAGLKLVWGTDAVAGSHGRNVDDLICRVREAGQPAGDALISATARAAESLGLGQRIGTLAAGFDADVIAVRGNPLDDIGAMKQVVFVMRGGRVVRHDGAPR